MKPVKFNDFITEEKKSKKYKILVVSADPAPEGQKLFRTARRFKEEGEKQGHKVYVVQVEGAFIDYEDGVYTIYNEGDFYNWHVDSFLDHPKEPPVRKLSMSCLLSPDNEFEGGGMEFFTNGNEAKLKQGQAIFFASYIRHRIKPVEKGNRKSLVVWFGGPPFK